jgi:hypothetical protein
MKIIILSVTLFLMANTCLSAIEPVNAEGEYGWKMLTIPPSPSISAMGGTGASVSPEAISFIQHPTAGLMGKANSVTVTQDLWIFDTQINGVAINRSSAQSSFGFAIRTLDYGKQEARDISGEVIGEFYPLDINLAANYSRRITPNTYGGLNVFLLYQKIDSSSSVGMATDLGLSYITPLDGLYLHGALKHIGFTTIVKDERIKLPVTPEISIGYHFPSITPDVYIEFKTLKHPDDNNIKLAMGSKIRVVEALQLRLGYLVNYDSRDFTAGMGLSLKQFNIDYAYLPFKDNVDDTHSFGITYRF